MADKDQIERLFHEALEVPEPQRAAFLRRACGSDEELRRELESLLEAEGSLPTSAFEHPVVPVLTADSPAPQRHLGERPGDTVGPYRLLEPLGEGGFGTVYLAERREPIVQRVALKIIKPGMDSAAVIARFELERQTLALLDHPGIAKVFDAGATAGGRPYFVMELVEGQPLTALCDRHTLTTAARLDLFAQVCDAVQHAHSKGIIHRDLKPSNILVSLKDGRALPKVIDFGIAKAIDPQDGGRTVFTAEGTFIGTPDYMSPEQAAGEPDIDTRADVYALGVVLYEVLTGLLPFDARTLRAAGFTEVQRIIREVDPPRPSARLGALGARADQIARARATDAPRLIRELKRELEWVPLQAMRKARTERYATAKELGDDVRNYLGSRPLRAGPDSTWYTARKIVRRHRVAVAAGACVLAAVVSGAALATYWAVKESRARSAEQRQRQVADAVNTFLNDMLGAADPRLPRARRAKTVREAIDTATRRLDTGALAAEPAVEAAVRGTIGNALFGIGEPALSEKELRRALELAAQAHGEGSLPHAAAMHNLAEVLLDSADPGEAERLAHAAAGLRAALLDPEDPLTNASRDVEALAMFRQGRYDETIRANGALLPVRERVSGPTSVPVAETLAILGNALWATGRAREAAERWTRALANFSSNFGDDHPYAIMCTNNLALAAQGEGRLDEAEALSARAVGNARRVLGSMHPDLAVDLAVLASIKLERGDAQGALDLAGESADVRRRLLGEDHPAVAESLRVLGAAARQTGDLKGAIDAFSRGAAIERRHVKAIGPERLTRTLMNLASALTASGDGPGAAGALEECVPILRGLPDHPLLGRALSDLAYAYLLTSRAQPAADTALKALALLGGPDDDRARTLLIRATALATLGRPAEAEPLVREAVKIRSALFPDGSWQVASGRSTLGAVLTSLERFEEAQTELLAAFEAFGTATGVPPHRRREAAARLADLYRAWGKDEEAAKWRQEAERAD